MNIDSCIHKGALHENHNEDSLYHTTITDTWIVAAVMDGCSTGTESFFASHLYKKLIHRTCKTLPLLDNIYPDFKLDKMSADDLGEYMLEKIFEDTVKFSKSLLLDQLEVLSTLLFAVYSIPSKELWVDINGDGYIAINNEITEFNQNNVPDFMGYHLKKKFLPWFENHTQTILEKEVNTFSLSTDGTSKFFDGKSSQLSLIDHSSAYLTTSNIPLEELFLEHKNSKNFPYDDIAVIRVAR